MTRQAPKPESLESKKKPQFFIEDQKTFHIRHLDPLNQFYIEHLNILYEKISKTQLIEILEEENILNIFDFFFGEEFYRLQKNKNDPKIIVELNEVTKTLFLSYLKEIMEDLVREDFSKLSSKKIGKLRVYVGINSNKLETKKEESSCSYQDLFCHLSPLEKHKIEEIERKKIKQQEIEKKEQLAEITRLSIGEPLEILASKYITKIQKLPKVSSTLLEFLEEEPFSILYMALSINDEELLYAGVGIMQVMLALHTIRPHLDISHDIVGRISQALEKIKPQYLKYKLIILFSKYLSHSKSNHNEPLLAKVRAKMFKLNINFDTFISFDLLTFEQQFVAYLTDNNYPVEFSSTPPILKFKLENLPILILKTDNAFKLQQKLIEKTVHERQAIDQDTKCDLFFQSLPVEYQSYSNIIQTLKLNLQLAELFYLKQYHPAMIHEVLINAKNDIHYILTRLLKTYEQPNFEDKETIETKEVNRQSLLSLLQYIKSTVNESQSELSKDFINDMIPDNIKTMDQKKIAEIAQHIEQIDLPDKIKEDLDLLQNFNGKLAGIQKNANDESIKSIFKEIRLSFTSSPPISIRGRRLLLLTEFCALEKKYLLPNNPNFESKLTYFTMPAKAKRIMDKEKKFRAHKNKADALFYMSISMLDNPAKKAQLQVDYEKYKQTYINSKDPGCQFLAVFYDMFVSNDLDWDMLLKLINVSILPKLEYLFCGQGQLLFAYIPLERTQLICGMMESIFSQKKEAKQENDPFTSNPIFQKLQEAIASLKTDGPKVGEQPLFPKYGSGVAGVIKRDDADHKDYGDGDPEVIQLRDKRDVELIEPNHNYSSSDQQEERTANEEFSEIQQQDFHTKPDAQKPEDLKSKDSKNVIITLSSQKFPLKIDDVKRDDDQPLKIALNGNENREDHKLQQSERALDAELIDQNKNISESPRVAPVREELKIGPGNSQQAPEDVPADLREQDFLTEKKTDAKEKKQSYAELYQFQPSNEELVKEKFKDFFSKKLDLESSTKACWLSYFEFCNASSNRIKGKEKYLLPYTNKDNEDKNGSFATMESKAQRLMFPKSTFGALWTPAPEFRSKEALPDALCYILVSILWRSKMDGIEITARQDGFLTPLRIKFNLYQGLYIRSSDKNDQFMGHFYQYIFDLATMPNKAKEPTEINALPPKIVDKLKWLVTNARLLFILLPDQTQPICIEKIIAFIEKIDKKNQVLGSIKGNLINLGGYASSLITEESVNQKWKVLMETITGVSAEPEVASRLKA